MTRTCGFPDMLKAMLASGFRKPKAVVLSPSDYNDIVSYCSEFHPEAIRGVSVVDEFLGVKLNVSLSQQPGQWSFRYEENNDEERG